MARRIDIHRECLTEAPYNKGDGEKSPDVSLDSVGTPKSIHAGNDANASKRELQRIGYEWAGRSRTHSAYDCYVESSNYPSCTNQAIA